MKLKLSLLFSFAAVLVSACAGGGQTEPKVPVAIPALPKIADFKPSAKNADVETISTSANGGQLVRGDFTSAYPTIFGDVDKQTDAFAYRTPDGKYYQISSFNSPIIASTNHPQAFPTTHPGQPLDDGGKILICCHQGSSADRYFPATRQDYVRFGVWMGANGETDLFVGGLPVGKAGILPGVTKGTGKATYEVWAFRAKDGKIASSSYFPSYQNDKPVLSLLTANFNTNKLGGTIVGNQDYGPDVVMKDVDINGIDFAGTAESGGKDGRVEGKFFGKFDSTWQEDRSIGGKVTFEADKSLDTVFAGVERYADRDSQSQDLTPLEK